MCGALTIGLLHAWLPRCRRLACSLPQRLLEQRLILTSVNGPSLILQQVPLRCPSELLRIHVSKGTQ